MDKTQIFIAKAIQVHGETYDYSKVTYKTTKDKVTIICKKHGDFMQVPPSHLKGAGCKKCGTERAASLLSFDNDSFIKKAKEIHGDKYDYSKVQYKQIYSKIEIICKIHGNFFQVPRDHLKGTGCRKCGNETISNKLRGNTDSFIKKAITIHGNKYNYENVKYVNIDTPVTIVCKAHGNFEQKPDYHLAGHGCQLCAGNIRYTTQEWISLATKMYGDKYDYSKVNYVNSKTKVTIICDEHGEWDQIPGSHLLGYECPKCAFNWQCSTSEWITKAQKTHGNEYDYSKTNYVNNKAKVVIICKKHGEFEQNPGSHVSGCRCPKCMGGVGHTIVEFIDNAIKKHGLKYDYSKVKYVNQSTKVIIICPKHGEFEQSPNGHLSGRECYRCSMAGYSRKSIKCLDYIAKRDNIFIQHAENLGEFRIPNTKFKADGYCKETNTIYEHHGDLYHGCPKCFDENDINPVSHVKFKDLYDKTIAREELLRSHGYKLVSIWEHEWDIVSKKNSKCEYFPSEILQFSSYELCMLISERIELCEESNEIKKFMSSLNVDFTGFSQYNFHEYRMDIGKLFGSIISCQENGRRILFLLNDWTDYLD